jgi:hydrogenase small subunit
MDEPSGARFSTAALTAYGKIIRALRSMTNNTVNGEPEWRKPGRELITGYKPRPGAYRPRPVRKVA